MITERRITVRDEQVRELHLEVNLVDLIPTEYGSIEHSFDTLVLHVAYTDFETGRTRIRKIEVPSRGF